MKSALSLFPKFSFFAFVVIFCAFARHTPAQDCTTVTDEDIVTAIVDEIKGDSLLSGQLSHIVVGSVNKFAKLQGWTDNKRGYDRLISIVSGVKCVKAINVNRFEEIPPPADSPSRPQSGGGCAPGMKACGDVCIPDGDTCSARTKAGDE